MAQKTEVRVGRRKLQLSNLDKVFYPATGMTKGDVIAYYREIAPVLLPHLRNRFVTLKRYPNGVDGKFFYEKECPSHRPEWVATAPMVRKKDKKAVNYCLLNDLPSLVWSANLANLELHTSLACAKDFYRPTALVFDLDPGPPAAVLQCAEVALLVRAILEEAGLEAFAKTSGSKGIQLFAPLNTAVTYDDTKPFAHQLALRLQEEHRDLVLSSQSRAEREGKVLVDWSQNDDHKTTASVYSLRAKERPTASTPVTWDEVEAALKKRRPERLSFEASEVLARVEQHGDLFEPVRKLKQKLPR
ncbi:MAG: non-homologous end-joining DNA ligase [Actinomycetota bacterium]|nr:non-homologous end-joining DNA ligase [Actinomycetota bacterium]